MSIPKPIYMNFYSIIKEKEEKSVSLHKKITQLKDSIGTGTNTIGLENEIEKEISSLKEAHQELDNAYSTRNAPSTIGSLEIDRRQKEIKKLEISIQEIVKNFKEIQNEKYQFKGGNAGEYQPTEEMKTMSNEELMQLQQQKIKDQEQQLDNIFLDVKKGRVLTKEAGQIMEEQNKQLDELQKDIDKLDSKLVRGAERFQNYAAKKSGCCISIILVIELVAGILIYFLL